MKARHLRHALAMFVLASVGGGCLGCYAWMAHGVARQSLRDHAAEHAGATPPPLITLPGSPPATTPPAATTASP